MSNDLAVAGDVRRHHRQAGRHGLQEDDAEALAAGVRSQEDIDRGVIVGQVPLGDAPQHEHSVCNIRRELLDGPSLRTVTGYHQDRPGELLGDLAERPDREPEALPRLEPPNEQQPRCPGQRRRLGVPELLDVQAVRHHTHRTAEVAAGLARSVFPYWAGCPKRARYSPARRRLPRCG